MARVPGSGKPKGYKAQHTLTKEAARALLCSMVIRSLQPMTESQIANAMGIRFLMVRQKSSGKFLRVSEVQAEKLEPDEEIIEVWQKDPSVQSYADLMNRALGKPAEHVELTGADGVPLVVQWLQQP